VTASKSELKFRNKNSEGKLGRRVDEAQQDARPLETDLDPFGRDVGEQGID